MKLGDFVSLYLDDRKWEHSQKNSLDDRARVTAVNLLAEIGVLPLAAMSAQNKTTKENLQAGFELADFVAYGLSSNEQLSLASYCAWKTGVSKTPREKKKLPAYQLAAITYDAVCDRVNRNLHVAVTSAWTSTSVQQVVFPRWYKNSFGNNHVARNPAGCTIAYGIFNACVRQLEAESEYAPEEYTPQYIILGSIG